MAEVPQADFTRAVRGANISGQDEIEPVVGGISSVARATIRRIHREGTAKALAYYASGTKKFSLMGGNPASTVNTYRASVDQYVAWDGGQAAPADIDVSETISFAPGDAVRAIAHVAIDAPADREVRVLLWDELRLDQNGAEQIALPALEAVENAFGQGVVAVVEVWQLATGQRVTVPPTLARARHSDVQTLLASL